MTYKSFLGDLNEVISAIPAEGVDENVLFVRNALVDVHKAGVEDEAKQPNFAYVINLMERVDRNTRPRHHDNKKDAPPRKEEVVKKAPEGKLATLGEVVASHKPAKTQEATKAAPPKKTKEEVAQEAAEAARNAISDEELKKLGSEAEAEEYLRLVGEEAYQRAMA